MTAPPDLATGWRPISSAPKDGETVLTMHREDLYPVAAYYLEGSGWLRETEGPEDAWYPPGRHEALYREPTHWMPIPESPAPPEPSRP